MFEYMIDDIQVEVVFNLLRIRVERHEDIEIKEEWSGARKRTKTRCA